MVWQVGRGQLGWVKLRSGGFRFGRWVALRRVKVAYGLFLQGSVWQVRRVTARRVMWSSGCFGWGLAGEVRLGEMRWVLAWSDEVGLGLAGRVRCI